MLKIAFFASGSGTNMSAVLDRIEGGDLQASVQFVLSNNSKSGALARATKSGISTYHVSTVTEGGEENVPVKMLNLLRDHQVELLVLAGYMKKLPPEIVEFLPGRVINIHPALLPAFGGPGFYGDKIHQAVLNRGCQFTGVTVHAVDPEYDEGPIILQRAVAVKPGSSLEDLRNDVLKVEYDSLWRVISGYSSGILKPTEKKLHGIPQFQASLEKDLQPTS